MTLKSIAPYVQTCKDSGSLLAPLGGKTYLLGDEHVYSLKDLILVKQDEFLPFLGKLLQQYSSHLKTCKVFFLFC